MNKFRLLVTRKISPSLTLRAGLNGIDILEKEFISIEPIVSEELTNRIGKILSSKKILAFTSKNAVQAVAANKDLHGENLKIYCLEGATAEEVRKLIGKEHIAGTAMNAEKLGEVIRAAGEKNIVFFCGNQRRDDLPEILSGAGVEVEELIVYQTLFKPQQIIDDFEAIAFFSPSAVKSFFSENTLRQNVTCVSVGNTTTEAIREHCSNRTLTAKKPSEESVLELAKELKNNM